MICSHQGTNEPLGLVAAQWPGRQVDTDPTDCLQGHWGVEPKEPAQEQPAPTAGSGPGAILVLNQISLQLCQHP